MHAAAQRETGTATMAFAHVLIFCLVAQRPAAVSHIIHQKLALSYFSTAKKATTNDRWQRERDCARKKETKKDTRRFPGLRSSQSPGYYAAVPRVRRASHVGQPPPQLFQRSVQRTPVTPRDHRTVQLSVGFQVQHILDGRKPSQRAEILHEYNTWADGDAVRNTLERSKNVSRTYPMR